MGSARVVFWDFDGTLARREGLWAGAMAEALARSGASTVLHPAQLRPHLRTGFPWHTPDQPWGAMTGPEWWGRMRPVFQTAYVHAGLDVAVAAHAAEFVALEYYRPDAWDVVDGATDALQITREAGYLNVVLSNHPPELTGLVTALGLGALVDLVVTSAEAGAEKPNRLAFEHALRVADAGPDVWMVGDNPAADLAGAEALGIRAILADGAYDDSLGVTVCDSARLIAAAARAVD